MTNAARTIAYRNPLGHLSYPVAPRRQSLEIAEHDLAPVAFVWRGNMSG
ncbi:MAG: hypothetical protein GDA53_08235 [Rhodobacteraceae bacterium]|nr:hypothetical protein [Paracoccaceae bacterium]